MQNYTKYSDYKHHRSLHGTERHGMVSSHLYTILKCKESFSLKTDDSFQFRWGQRSEHSRSKQTMKKTEMALKVKNRSMNLSNCIHRHKGYT